MLDLISMTCYFIKWLFTFKHTTMEEAIYNNKSCQNIIMYQEVINCGIQFFLKLTIMLNVLQHHEAYIRILKS